jgi:hypothetical protein
MCSVPWTKGVLICPWENLCRNECPSQVLHDILQFLVFLKVAIHWRDRNNCIDLGILSIPWLHPVCAVIFLALKCINFFGDTKWFLLVTLRILAASVCIWCFDEIRDTEAWKQNLLVPSVLYFATHKGSSSKMMGDVVLGGKLPHPM